MPSSIGIADTGAGSGRAGAITSWRRAYRCGGVVAIITGVAGLAGNVRVVVVAIYIIADAVIIGIHRYRYEQ